MFFLAAEPLTDKITWQNGNRYTFRLRPNTYMQAAMLVPEAAKLQKKRWVVVYPNYEYGQSAAATFKAMLKKLQPDVEFLPDQATPLGRIEAGAVVQALADAKPDAIFNVLFGADLSKFVREGNTREPVQGPRGREPADRRARVHRAAARTRRRSAGSSPAIRTTASRPTSTRSSSSPTSGKYNEYPQARLGGRLRDDHGRSPRASDEGEVDRHREADRRVQRACR